MLRFLIAALLVSTASTRSMAEDALQAPFGISMGQALSSLAISRRESGGHVELKQVPKPHASLPKYSVIATDEAGVCEVVGYASLEPADKAERRLAIVRTHLTELLGQPQFLPGDRTPESTGIWMWGELSKGLQRHPVDRIVLYRYETGGRGATMLKFVFSNRAKCEPAMPANGFR